MPCILLIPRQILTGIKLDQHRFAEIQVLSSLVPQHCSQLNLSNDRHPKCLDNALHLSPVDESISIFGNDNTANSGELLEDCSGTEFGDYCKKPQVSKKTVEKTVKIGR